MPLAAGLNYRPSIRYRAYHLIFFPLSDKGEEREKNLWFVLRRELK